LCTPDARPNTSLATGINVANFASTNVPVVTYVGNTAVSFMLNGSLYTVHMGTPLTISGTIYTYIVVPGDVATLTVVGGSQIGTWTIGTDPAQVSINITAIFDDMLFTEGEETRVLSQLPFEYFTKPLSANIINYYLSILVTPDYTTIDTKHMLSTQVDSVSQNFAVDPVTAIATRFGYPESPLVNGNVTIQGSKNVLYALNALTVKLNLTPGSYNGFRLEEGGYFPISAMPFTYKNVVYSASVDPNAQPLPAQIPAQTATQAVAFLNSLLKTGSVTITGGSAQSTIEARYVNGKRIYIGVGLGTLSIRSGTNTYNITITS
jgi:hypothetical protein